MRDLEGCKRTQTEGGGVCQLSRLRDAVLKMVCSFVDVQFGQPQMHPLAPRATSVPTAS